MGQLAAFLVSLLGSMLGTGAARVLTGAGLAVVSFAGLKPVIDAALQAIQDYWGGLPGGLAAIAAISGLGVGMGFIGTAIIIRVGIDSAKIGLKKAAS